MISEFNAPLTAQALHTEIKGKKEKVEDVQKNADTCAASIKVGSQLMCNVFFHFTNILYICVCVCVCVYICMYIYIYIYIYI